MDRDPAAFRTLYETHYGAVCRYLARRVDTDLPAHAMPWLLSALATLRETDRELLLLRHWDGLAPREAAAVLGLGPVLVRTRMHRAERRLRTALRAALEEEDVTPLPIELTEVT